MDCEAARVGESKKKLSNMDKEATQLSIRQ